MNSGVIKFVVGVVQDIKGPKAALVSGVSALVLGYLSLMAGRSSFFIYTGSFLVGAPMSLVMVILPVRARSLFGNREYTRIYGYIAMFGNLCFSLCLSLFGLIIDRSGYTVSQTVCAILALMMLLLGFVSLRLKNIVR